MSGSHFEKIRYFIWGFVGILLAVIFIFIVLFLVIRGRKFDPDRDSFNPDFAVRILCPGYTVPSDGFWERAFIQLGFRPLNPPALARKYENYHPAGGQSIWGLDADGRILHTYMPTSSYGDVTIALYSTPPTAHNVQLETMIRSAINQTDCNVQSVHLYDNKPQARQNFLKFLQDVRTWYAEADALEHR